VANHESALKAHKQSEERRERNRQYRTRLRHALKAMRAAISKGDKDAALANLSDTVSLIDKLVGKGVIHDNAAGRYKSRLMKRISRTGATAAATK
jgi:small subunit ribosomal protein S20